MLTRTTTYNQANADPLRQLSSTHGSQYGGQRWAWDRRSPWASVGQHGAASVGRLLRRSMGHEASMARRSPRIGMPANGLASAAPSRLLTACHGASDHRPSRARSRATRLSMRPTVAPDCGRSIRDRLGMPDRSRATFAIPLARRCSISLLASITSPRKIVTPRPSETDEASTDGSFIVAQTNGQDRRGGRQDCRQQEGAARRGQAQLQTARTPAVGLVSRGAAARGVSTSSVRGACLPLSVRVSLLPVPFGDEASREDLEQGRIHQARQRGSGMALAAIEPPRGYGRD